MKQMTEQDGKSLDIVGENLDKLKIIFPEAFTEDGVDFEVLRQLLGDAVDDGEEKYGLNWHGKKKARQIALMPSLGTLRPCPEESVDWDTTQNLFIEGDNLEVLKLLQKSYANKVKMIYIDPPYNTGKEFIYPDRFQDNLDTYLRYTGQKDANGFKVSSNTESSGRYHTNWLNMMYPRLKLAKHLLRDDGLVFVSIDDNEVKHLLSLMDDIFGEENFVGSVCWKNKYGAGAKTKGFIEVHEYILCYSKTALINIESILSEEQMELYKKLRDGKYETRGGFVTQPLMTNSLDDRANLQYDIEYNGDTISPRKQWVWGKDRLLVAIENNEVIFKKKSNGEYSVRAKVYLRNENGVLRKGKPLSLLNGPFNQGGTKEVADLMGENVFSFPKPSSLVRHFFGFTVNEKEESNGIYLDFFSGSCSSAQAVLDLNKEDTGKRRYIMVQLPEPCNEKSEAFKAGYKTIAEIGKERIRRAATKIKEENPEYEGDLGFKVFKLDSSNIRAWNPDRSDLEQTLLDHTEHLVEGRSEEDILYELLLKRGVDLTVPIDEKIITGKTVYSIGYGVLFACLDIAISREEVEDLAGGIISWHTELKPAGDTQVVFRDSAFANDIAKTNMTAILEQHGIAHVRSI
jgi:adenine-specific DNA-methyltransferase